MGTFLPGLTPLRQHCLLLLGLLDDGFRVFDQVLHGACHPMRPPSGSDLVLCKDPSRRPLLIFAVIRCTAPSWIPILGKHAVRGGIHQRF